MERLSVRERVLWVLLGIQRHILWVALGVVLALVIVQNMSFRIPNPGFDAEAVRQTLGQ
jgi:hypothetical protein